MRPGRWGGEDETFHALSANDIERSRWNMVKASLLAAEAGFDGVDFKLCHGHMTYRLLAKTNRRSDEWGGTGVEERSKYVVGAITEVREALDQKKMNDFILGARVSENDLDELGQLVDVLDKQLNLDFISVSTCGDTLDSEVLSILAQYVVGLKSKARIIQSGFTGTMTDPDNLFGAMLQALAMAMSPDFLGLGRQSLADPLTPDKLRTNSVQDINICKRCNACYKLPHCKHFL